MDTQFGKFPSLSQDELKEFVLGWCDNKLFSSEHIARMARGYENDEWVNNTRVVFLPISFGCLDCPVKRPEEPEKAPQELLDAIEWGEDSEDSLEPYKEAQALYERELEAWDAIDRAWGKYLAENIGVVWEWYDQSLPRGVNGMPMFMSCRIMNVTDWERAKKAIDKELDRRAKVEV